MLACDWDKATGLYSITHTWWRHQMEHFPRYWPFVRGIQWSPVNSPHKGKWRGALMFSLIFTWLNGWVNSREAGDLRRYRAHYDVIVMIHGLAWHCDNLCAQINWCNIHLVTFNFIFFDRFIWCVVFHVLRLFYMNLRESAVLLSKRLISVRYDNLNTQSHGFKTWNFQCNCLIINVDIQRLSCV